MSFIIIINFEAITTTTTIATIATKLKETKKKSLYKIILSLFYLVGSKIQRYEKQI